MLLAKITDLQIIFVDPKHEHHRFGDGDTLDTPKLVTRYDPECRVQIFQQYYWDDNLDDMVDKVLRRIETVPGGKVVVVFDEIGGLATATVVPVGMVRLYTQGGGKGVGTWSMLQGVKRVPRVIKSQTEIWFVFRITDEDDRMDLYSFIPDHRIEDMRVPPHYFFAYRDDWDEAKYFRPIKLPEKWKPK